ncbi:LysR family transcriptional regulator [Paracraurococcus ruber]|nr:LysR family transcriptional regulator [Paracraurococcus ruber]
MNKIHCGDFVMNLIHNAGLDLNLLRVFDAVMQARSASGAAGLLGVSQSAVSHGLARLREIAGDPLFVRSGGRMEPTPRAQRMAAPVRDALVLAAETLRGDAGAAFDPARGRRAFTIGAGDYAATAVLGGLVTEIAAAGWDIGLSVLPADRFTAPRMLDAGEIDLAIGLLPFSQHWHERQALFVETQACLFDGRRLGLSAPVSVAEFLSLPHLVPSLKGEFDSFVDEELAARGQARRSILATAHFLSIPLLLRSTAAFATLPTRLCAACANAASLTISPLPVPVRQFEVSMLWHRRDSASAAQRWLRDRIAATNPPDPRDPPPCPG